MNLPTAGCYSKNQEFPMLLLVFRAINVVQNIEVRREIAVYDAILLRGNESKLD